MELEEAKTILANSETAIRGILNDLEARLGGTVIDIDISVRQISEPGRRIPFVKINFKLDTPH